MPSACLCLCLRPQHKASYLTVQCKECHSTQVVACKPGLGGAMLPRRCETVDPVTNQACPLNSWVVLGERSKYVDQQTLKLQVRWWQVLREAGNRGPGRRAGCVRVCAAVAHA